MQLLLTCFALPLAILLSTSVSRDHQASQMCEKDDRVGCVAGGRQLGRKAGLSITSYSVWCGNCCGTLLEQDLTVAGAQ